MDFRMIMCDMIAFLGLWDGFSPCFQLLLVVSCVLTLVLWSLGRCMVGWAPVDEVEWLVPYLVLLNLWLDGFFLAHRRFLVEDLVSW
jgi:hypothetical protein